MEEKQYMDEITTAITCGGRDIILKVNSFSLSWGGAVMIESGDTAVLVTASRSNGREAKDFLNISVNYEERLYARGKMPNSLSLKGPSEKELRTACLIERCLRPMFSSWLLLGVHIEARTLSIDEDVPPDVLALLGSSVAPYLAGLPRNCPFAAVRVAKVGDDMIINPSYAQIQNSRIDLVVAGTEKGVIMLDGGADQFEEPEIADAITFGYNAIREIVEGQNEFCASFLLPEAELGELLDSKGELKEWILKYYADKIDEFVAHDKADLVSLQSDIAEDISGLPEADSIRVLYDSDSRVLDQAFKEATLKLISRRIVDGVRLDGRTFLQVSPVSCGVGVLPKRVHGSSFFNGGFNQVMSAVTLGFLDDENKLADGSITQDEKRYLHQCIFAPNFAAEAKPWQSVGFREISEADFARRALLPVMPKSDVFPFAFGLVSEVLLSDGSTSTASVCASSLSLMDAGVPIQQPVGAVAMALLRNSVDLCILSDIRDQEDLVSDMDMKVAGTANGITAIQMDVKGDDGVSTEEIEQVLSQAKAARKPILQKMLSLICKPRSNLSPYAPRVQTFKIDPDMIDLVIGKEVNGATIHVAPDGTVTVRAEDGEKADIAYKLIQGLTVKIIPGNVYVCRVTKIVAFGAFCEVAPGKEGLLHISQIAEYRVNKVEDEISVGDEVVLKVRDIDDLGRVNLSRLNITPDEVAAARAKQ